MFIIYSIVHTFSFTTNITFLVIYVNETIIKEELQLYNDLNISQENLDNDSETIEETASNKSLESTDCPEQKKLIAAFSSTSQISENVFSANPPRSSISARYRPAQNMPTVEAEIQRNSKAIPSIKRRNSGSQVRPAQQQFIQCCSHKCEMREKYMNYFLFIFFIT